MKESKSLPPEDSRIQTIGGWGRVLPLSGPGDGGSGHFLLCSVSWNLVLV